MSQKARVFGNVVPEAAFRHSVNSLHIRKCQDRVRGKALRELGHPELVSEQMDAISLAYASLLLNREYLYTVEGLGAADSMVMMSYMAVGVLPR